jgi:hypothetical protein
MRAGHLDDEGALNLIPGLGALDECQAGIHSDFFPLFGSRGERPISSLSARRGGITPLIRQQKEA